MSTYPLLNWFGLTISILNVIYMLWLGMTILLNAERRVWGVWLAGGSLILGAAFFISHSIILARGLVYPDWRFQFWWKAGLVPAHVLPYAWYIVILWYGGFWQPGLNRLRQRQRHWLWLITAAMLCGLVILIFYPNSLFPFSGFAPEGESLFNPANQIFRPLIMFFSIAFALYIIVCLILALDVVRRPEPSIRMMGAEAHSRARPWLIGASIMMLFVTFLVTFAILWILRNLMDGFDFLLYQRTYNLLTVLDLIIQSLILMAVLMQGQAIVSYELFTGKSLPRRAIRSQWGIVLVTGLIAGLLISTLTFLQVPVLHGLLLGAILVFGGTAMLGKRTYVERTQMLHELRPFISSQRLYEHLLSDTIDDIETSPSAEAVDIQPAFDALCRDLLGASVGFLYPQGPLATLVNQPLVWPRVRDVPILNGLLQQVEAGGATQIHIDPQHFQGAHWAIPLQSKHGVIGLFLLGNRLDGGLYTEEDIAAARAGGERLMDTLAGAELTRRLILLQRQKMVETQLVDQKTRRTLHDEVLPKIHTAILSLYGEDEKPDAAIESLTEIHKEISDLLHQIPSAAIAPVQKHGLTGALQRLLKVDMAHHFDETVFGAKAEDGHEADQLSPIKAEVVYYACREALRNAAKHGRGGNQSAKLQVSLLIERTDELNIVIQDNGVGVTNTAPAPNPNGSGHGLTLHSTLLAVVGGQLLVESREGAFTRVTIKLPE